MAQYVHVVDRNQPMLLPPAVDDYVAPDSPLRALDAFADSLDLAKLGFAVRGAGAVGRTSYDPGVMLKLYLWGYLKRCRSSRGLEEACGTNLGVIWLTGNQHPDHSTISDFRKRHAGPLKEIFKQFSVICMKLGLFGRERVAIDGTFIKAVNSKARSFTTGKLTKLIEGIDKAIARYLEQLDTTDSAEEELEGAKAGAAELHRKIEKIRERRGEYESLLEQCEKSETGQVSLTDADSVQLCKGDKRTVGYNVQAAVDAKHHLIVSVEVTQDGNDRGQLNAMAQQAKEGMGMEPDASLKVLADSGYGVGVELAACEANNTEAYVPIPKAVTAGDGTYTDADFTYQAESDSYTCPKGKTLTRKADRHRAEGGSFRTYYDAGQCRGCPMLGRCTKGKFRIIMVSFNKPAVDAARERLAGAPGSMRKRGAIAEHPFGTIKDRHGRQDLLCKGLPMAKAEMGLSFWAYNFTRVMKIVGLKGLMEAITAKTGQANA